MEKVIMVVGPTAVGKSDLGIQLAQKFQGEIISGDSMQVYRHLDIGTAKVFPAEMAGIPHHLLNIRNVDESFSAYDFQQAATQLVDEITGRGHVPIVVGGTGFYLRMFWLGWTLGHERHTDDEDTALDDAAAWTQLYQKDPVAAAKIPVTNRRRVDRALAVIAATGHLFSDQGDTLQPAMDALFIGLHTDRQQLYTRINQRVTQMITAGLEGEARWLYAHDGTQVAAGKGIGYREWWPYFAGERTKAEVVERIQADSRHYAKRQLTYFRHQLPVQWFDLLNDPNAAANIDQAVTDFLAK
ncbi:tRNA (adenosine(37)-N6)-dimethylallyltransferase MiaA [Schleiferilactobacillus perolens]|uniref:tRNA (adenosine(37)-N6)-dimethylallyltransferase MiaA n=1 Tax=Schleiferilactobacillus perolens TaxID=100468 RepID=UPI0023561213|nr:tRNA (adenosine(37)-N6)-dimethylallyltransferase MiaA [Schleiferilactobacillus perolens]MCI2171877.1 tRNA (adenosine(37)-N6)-dimethylallyltransferase MiaA [Schleiferilactobacillus perolens]